MGAIALHTIGASLALTAALVIGGIGAAAIAGLALAALVRRRSIPYLLVALAILTILARALVGGFSLQGGLDPNTHHLIEHLLDVVMVGLVIAAVVLARSGTKLTS